MTEPIIRITDLKLTIDGHDIGPGYQNGLDLRPIADIEGNFSIELDDDAWARFTEHMVFSREPGKP